VLALADQVAKLRNLHHLQVLEKRFDLPVLEGGKKFDAPQHCWCQTERE